MEFLTDPRNFRFSCKGPFLLLGWNQQFGIVLNEVENKNKVFLTFVVTFQAALLCGESKKYEIIQFSNELTHTTTLNPHFYEFCDCFYHFMKLKY